MPASLQDWATERGYQVAWGNPSLVDDVRAEIENRKVSGDLNEAFYGNSLSEFRYLDEVELPRVKWLLVFAVPRPAHRLAFELDMGILQTLVPPTYVFYRRTTEMVLEDLRSTLLGDGAYLVPLRAPLKAVAAHLGLVAYGRNNLGYARGFGSYHQLVGCLTDADLDLPPAATHPASLAPECQSCRACRDSCPTGAICQERILLHVEHCLTLVNEAGGSWPEWVPPSAHQCLVGCLACQRICPKNAGLLKYEPIEESFNRQETARILTGEPDERDPLWTQIKAKIARIGLTGYESVMGRNLGALLATNQIPPRPCAESALSAGQIHNFMIL